MTDYLKTICEDIENRLIGLSANGLTDFVGEIDENKFSKEDLVEIRKYLRDRGYRCNIFRDKFFVIEVLYPTPYYYWKD